MFKRRRFPAAIILLCVRWNCKYGISYRDLAEMIQERGVDVDPTSIMRWIRRYAPELDKRARRFQGYGSTSWRVDETYIRVGGRVKYLYRAVDKHGVLIDFMLRSAETHVRHTVSEQSADNHAGLATFIHHTDKLRSYPEAIEQLKREGKLSGSTRHLTSKYLNNIIEADHGALKQLIRPIREFQTMKSATAP